MFIFCLFFLGYLHHDRSQLKLNQNFCLTKCYDLTIQISMGRFFFNCWPRHWANILFFEWKLVVHRWTTLSTRPPQIVRHILYPSAWSGQSYGQDKTDVYKLQPNGTPQQCNLQKHTTGPNAYHFSTNG